MFRARAVPIAICIASFSIATAFGQTKSATADQMRSRGVHTVTLATLNRGKELHASGRAFYIPGQKLVLFVSGLSDSKMQTANAFYLWGSAPGSDQPVQSLGTLTLEDEKDERWAIRIENPDLLAGVSEIFITVESPEGTVDKPTGKPVLVAFLNNTRP